MLSNMLTDNIYSHYRGNPEEPIRDVTEFQAISERPSTINLHCTAGPSYRPQLKSPELSLLALNTSNRDAYEGVSQESHPN
jgi:hypothetical protein